MASAPRKEGFSELGGILLVALGILILASLISYHPLDPSFSTTTSNPDAKNLAGRFGAYIADALFVLFGAGAYLIPAFILYRGGRRFHKPSAEAPPPPRRLRVGFGGSLLLLISASAAGALYLKKLPILLQNPPVQGPAGGLIGGLLSEALLRYFAPMGTHLIVLTALLLSFMMVTSISLRDLSGKASEWLRELVDQTATWLRIFRGRFRRRHSAPRRMIPRQKPPEIVQPEPKPAVFKQERLKFSPPGDTYQLPPLSLLSDPAQGENKLSKEELLMSSKLLEKRFMDFSVNGNVTAVHPGPVVTLFEFQPAPGVKVQRVANLADDLALAMKATSVRIITPLPGKSTVGIEVPNTLREEVSLKEILASEEFREASASDSSPANGAWRSRGLPLALGKDIFGNPVVIDLTGMPHILVAGATGSGKSVALNTMLLSLLFSSTPQEVKFLLIDPKRLELSIYEEIPHLLAPVIYKPKEAARVLNRVVDEMQKRYRLLAEAGARNIDGYNQKVRDAEPLPYIVVIIDELADLMLISARDVEDSLMRLAQMARAAGIHLIVATQRPSVDVLTGVIKANFSARISFQVSSKTDSRTILDANGAEQLLGKGDMLFMSPGSGRMARVHGAYVSEAEIQQVVAHIKEGGSPDYRFELSGESGSSSLSGSAEERDDLYEEAVNLVMTTGQASASFIQRRMRVGYPRAARMIEMMEEDGLIGPAVGGKREVFGKQTLSRNQYDPSVPE